MTVLTSTLDAGGAAFAANRTAMEAALAPVIAVRAAVEAAGEAARAKAAKSGLNRSLPLTRPGYSRSWCMRMVP